MHVLESQRHEVPMFEPNKVLVRWLQMQAFGRVDSANSTSG